MNFSGWVQLRRGILDHLREGKLSINEFLALMVLIMLADKQTGAGTINAPALRYFIPELEYDAAKRVLLSLEEKRYIYRRIKHRSKIVYPYWVNRYAPSVGPHKGFRISLTKVFESKDIKDIGYIRDAPDNPPQGAPEGAPDPAPNYKKGEERKEKRNKTANSTESASVCASPGEAKPSGQDEEAKHNMQRPSALPSALPSKAQRGATVATSQPQTTAQEDLSRISAEDFLTRFGMQLPGDWHGITAHQFLSSDPQKLPREQLWDAQLKWQPNLETYVDLGTGNPVSWPDAIRRFESVRPPQPQTATSGSGISTEE